MNITKSRTEKQKFLLTMDLDWCPEWMLKKVLAQRQTIPIHFFMTNQSDWIENEIKMGANWSLGIHPNFEPQSSHGGDPYQVFKHLTQIFPQAISWRSHSLLTSNRVMQNSIQFSKLRVMSNRYDPNLDFPSPSVRKFANVEYLDLPVHFEDDLAIVDDPRFIRSKALMNLELKNKAVISLSFHPVHIFLNTIDMKVYDELRPLIYGNSKIEFIPPTHSDFGVGNLFENFLNSSPNLISFKELLSISDIVFS